MHRKGSGGKNPAAVFFDGLGVLPGNFKLMWFNKVNGNNYCKKKIECDPFFT